MTHEHALFFFLQFFGVFRRVGGRSSKPCAYHEHEAPHSQEGFWGLLDFPEDDRVRKTI